MKHSNRELHFSVCMGVVKVLFQHVLLHDGYKHCSPPPVNFMSCTGGAPTSRLGEGVGFAYFIKTTFSVSFC